MRDTRRNAPVLDYAIIGQYTACRLSLYLIGIAVSGVLAIPMVDFLGVIPAMILSGLCFTFSGGSYYVVVKMLLKEKRGKTPGTEEETEKNDN